MYNTETKWKLMGSTKTLLSKIVNGLNPGVIS